MDIKIIPKELINLTKLNLSGTKVKKIPKELIKLEELYCEGEIVLKIPNTFINLKKLKCFDSTNIKTIPKEFVNLTKLICYNTNIKNIPKELVNLKILIKPQNCIWDKSWIKNENEIQKIIILQRFWKRNGKFIIKLPVLWKIAEYYMSKKYSPENILKYVDLY